MSFTPVVTVTLTRPWGPFKAGESIEVDAIRAAALDEGGYLARPEEPEPKPRKRKGLD